MTSLFFITLIARSPGIVGVMTVSQLAYPDRLQFIKGHKYFDPKSPPDNPRWLNVDVQFVKRLPLVSLQELKTYSELGEMKILQRGNRLSITPLSKYEWDFIN